MIGSKITLTDSEQSVCRFIARTRFETNRQANIANPLRVKAEGWEQDLEGFGAELAFCRLFNAYPDLSTHIRSSAKGEDGDGDCLILGKTVDVKVTKYKNGKLLGLPWKKSRAEIYVLMVGQFPTFEYRGAMLSSDLYQEERLGNLGLGQSYIAAQSELSEIDHLGRE